MESTTLHPVQMREWEEIELTPPDASADLMRRAREAFDTWRRKSIDERLSFLRVLRHLIVDRMDEGMEIISQDTGKPKVEALTSDILTVLDAIRHAEKRAKHALKPRRVRTPISLIGKRSVVTYQPRGVVLVISPWNYPFQLSVVPVIEALAAGNAVILKPSEVTPRVGAWIATLFREAGFPEGVVQVAIGEKDLGARLIEEHPDYIFFTGSVQTGKIIQQEAAKRLIPTTLELGGKDPMIVFADANLNRAVQGAVWGALTNYGQVCMSVERIYVEEPIYDTFVEALKREVSRLRLNGGDEADLGTMTTEMQKEIVRRQVEDAVANGAKLVSGIHPRDWPKSGDLRIQPIILTGVDTRSAVMREETFGPVICVLPFRDEAEAIRAANDSVYGLSASVWTSDIAKARRVAQSLETGSVVINDVVLAIANPYLPFGGVKESGIGRYHGDEGYRIFCHEKSLLIDRGWLPSEVHWFPYQNKLTPFRTLVANLYGRKRSFFRFIRSYLTLLATSLRKSGSKRG
jgi:acyl-CoA reductase-like NAD-dependent aldehyde dehydrogenase